MYSKIIASESNNHSFTVCESEMAIVNLTVSNCREVSIKIFYINISLHKLKGILTVLCE